MMRIKNIMPSAVVKGNQFDKTKRTDSEKSLQSCPERMGPDKRLSPPSSLRRKSSDKSLSGTKSNLKNILGLSFGRKKETPEKVSNSPKPKGKKRVHYNGPSDRSIKSEPFQQTEKVDVQPKRHSDSPQVKDGLIKPKRKTKQASDEKSEKSMPKGTTQKKKLTTKLQEEKRKKRVPKHSEVKHPKRRERSPKRGVQFSDEAEVYAVVPRLSMYTPDEKLATWLAEEDFDEIIEECEKTVDKMEHGVKCRDKKYSSLGLEHWTEKGSKKKETYRINSWDAVLGEQVQQLEMGNDIWTPVAKVYHRESAQAQLEAALKALKIQKDVEKYVQKQAKCDIEIRCPEQKCTVEIRRRSFDR